MKFSPHQIAQVCHEANRGYQAAQDDTVGQPWGDLSKDEQNAIVRDVQGVLDGKSESPNRKERELFSSIVNALSDAPSSNDRVVVYQSIDSEWRWTRIAGNNRKIAASGEGFQDKSGAVTAAVRATGLEPQVIS